MIESITFGNFKALRDTTLPLGRFTLIVGANGSGKSTALSAVFALHYPHGPQFDASHRVRSANAQDSAPSRSDG